MPNFKHGGRASPGKAIAEILMTLSEYYDLEVENSVKKPSTYVEPTLILFLGVVTLFLALAVFLPWWNLASFFR
jgi:type II secretory pathway component PulF